MSDIVEIPVLQRDLEDMHAILRTVLDRLQAEDIARCYMQMSDPIYSPLTEVVKARFHRVEGLLKDFYADKYVSSLDERVAAEEPVESADEPLPPVQPALSLSMTPVKPALEFIDDEEHEVDDEAEDDG